MLLYCHYCLQTENEDILSKRYIELVHSSEKARLMRQVLVQKERFTQVQHNLGEWWTPVSKTTSSSCSSPQFLQGLGRKDSFSSTIILSTFGKCRPYPFIFLAFAAFSDRTSPCCHSGQWERLPSALNDCLPQCFFQKVTF